MKVSVIVPVYNVESYIRDCLESIVKQTLTNIEIIIVNDGSTDNSIANIQDMIDLNKNIKLINKLNGGLSSARNEGLKFARGEYIAFIDSDDYIDSDYLEKLYNEAKYYDLDIACGGNSKVYSNHNVVTMNRDISLYEMGVVSGEDFFIKQWLVNDFRGEVWDDLYKRSFLLENNLMFINGLLYEDNEFTPKVLKYATRVKLVNTYGYYYRQRDGSIMHSKKGSKELEDMQFILNEHLKLLNQSNKADLKSSYSKLITVGLYAYINSIMISNVQNKIKYFHSKQIKLLINSIKYNKDISLKQKLNFMLLKYLPRIYYFRLIKIYAKNKELI